MTQKDLRWFGVRCVFKYADKKAYEERVVIVLAKDFEHAIKKAEKEALDYAQTINVEYTGFVNAYMTDASKILDGAEVYSLIRDSDLDVDDYLDKFFDTGNEHTSEFNDKNPRRSKGDAAKQPKS